MKQGLGLGRHFPLCDPRTFVVTQSQNRCRVSRLILRTCVRFPQGHQEGGRRGTLPRASGSKGPHNMRILTLGNALKCVLSQSKEDDRNIFCSLRLQGALIHSFAPGPQKALSGPGFLVSFSL